MSNVLDIDMSELINSNVQDMNGERSSFTVSDVIRTPLSYTRCDNEILYAESISGLVPCITNVISLMKVGWQVKSHRVRAAAMAPH